MNHWNNRIHLEDSISFQIVSETSPINLELQTSIGIRFFPCSIILFYNAAFRYICTKSEVSRDERVALEIIMAISSFQLSLFCKQVPLLRSYQFFSPLIIRPCLSISVRKTQQYQRDTNVAAKYWMKTLQRWTTLKSSIFADWVTTVPLR